MEGLAIDSCTFFDMIKLNNIIEDEGQKNFFYEIENLEKDLKDKRNELKEIIDNEYLEGASGLSFEKKLDSIEIFYLKKINETKMLSKKAYGEVQRLKEIGGRKEDIENAIKAYNICVQNVAEYISRVKNIYSKVDSYKKIANKYYMAKILEKSLNGKLELYITSAVYDEIKNHIIENNSGLDKCMHHESEVDSFTKRHFTLINTKNQKVKQEIEDIAEKYRTPLNLNESPMSNHKNSNNVYGDSIIMAESNLSSLNIVTANIEDFIYDSGKDDSYFGVQNERIRNHICRVNQNNKSITTNAIPLRLYEYYYESYPKEICKNKFVKYEGKTKKNENFKNEIELIEMQM